MPKVTRKLSAKKPGFFRAHLLSLSWALTIFILFILPGEVIPDIDFWTVDWEDKVAHVGVFAILALLAVWGERLRTGTSVLSAKAKLTLLLLCLAFGLLTEIIQSEMIATRYGSIGDVAADFVGALIGVLIGPPLLRRAERFFREKL